METGRLQISHSCYFSRNDIRFTALYVKNYLQTVLFQSKTKIDNLIYDLFVIPCLKDDTIHSDY